MREIDSFGILWPDWHIDEEIGHGSFGTVYRAHREDGFSKVVQEAAVKHIGIPADKGDDSLTGCTADSLEKYYTNQMNTLVR